MTGVIIQARLNSSRLPGKVLMKLADNRTILEWVIDRCKKSKADIVIVATPDDEIVDFCKERNIEVFKGSENNVLERYYKCAKKYNLDRIIRVTSDCPFVKTEAIDKLIREDEHRFEIISNPIGTGAEHIPFRLLEHCYLKNQQEREHVTTRMRDSIGYRQKQTENYSVDTMED